MVLINQGKNRAFRRFIGQVRIFCVKLTNNTAHLMFDMALFRLTMASDFRADSPII